MEFSIHAIALNTFSEIFCGFPLTTTNDHKKSEYRAMFPKEQINFLDLQVAPTTTESTFNRLMADGDYTKLAEIVSDKKARQAFALNGGKPVVTEESLLFIPHCGGWPGPFIADLDSYEARAAIIRSAYQERGATQPGDVVVMTTLALYTPETGTQFRHGILRGKIAPSPRGDSGFSWDPIVIPTIPGKQPGKTFAEMFPREKNSCSMRYQAVLALQRQPFQGNAQIWYPSDLRGAGMPGAAEI